MKQVCASQVGFAQTGAGEVRPLQVSAPQVRAIEAGPAQVGALKLRIDQPDTCKIESGENASGEITGREVRGGGDVNTSIGG